MVKLELKNFQSHKETALEFGAGVNVIVGVSDSGKSAILRALRWLWTSRPLGDYFVRWGEKECAVKLEINGSEIIRGKEKKQNYYSVNGKMMEAIKAEVPCDVSEALKLEDINWQGQRDLDFLLSLSPLEASKYIQKLCGLEAVPPILASLASMETENRKAIKETEEQKEEAERKVKAFMNFADVEKLTEELQRMQSSLDRMRGKEIDLDYCAEQAKTVQGRLEKGRGIPGMGKLADDLKALLPERKNLGVKIDLLELQLKNFALAENRLRRFANLAGLYPLAESLRSLHAQKSALPALDNLGHCVSAGRALQGLGNKRALLQGMEAAKRAAEAMLDDKKKARERDRIITDIISAITLTRCNLRESAAALEKAKAELPSVCPACGKPMEAA